MSNPDTNSQELAEDRTDLAEDRTIMATERTFAGWMRTSFGAIGIGLGFQALFSTLEPAWVPMAIASLFIALGAVLAITAQRRACRTFARLDSHQVDSPQRPRLKWIAYAVAGSAITLIAALWLLRAAP